MPQENGNAIEESQGSSKEAAEEEANAQEGQREGEGEGGATGKSAETAEGQAAEAAAAVDRPDWLPEKFWNTETKAPNVENLAKSYAELEKNRGTSPEKLKEAWEEERLAVRPEAPDKYTLPENEVFDPDLLAASPVVELWRNAAYEAGLPQEKFESVIEEFAKTEIEKQQKQFEEEKASLGENADARLEAAGLWGRKVFKEPEELEAFASMTTTASGIKAVEKLMKMMSDGGVTIETEEGGDKADTIESIRALMDTKAYYSQQHRDPAVVKRVQEFFAKSSS